MKRGFREPSEGEALLALQLRADKIEFTREFRALAHRRYRWDFFIAPDILVEVQGGVWNHGKSAHSHGAGLTRDAEKASLAAIHGYRTILATTAQVRSGEAVEWIKQAIRRVA